MQESQDPAQPRGCIATSYLTLHNFSTSTGIVNITKRQIYAVARFQSKKIYLCAGNAKVINGEVAVLADNMADNTRSSLSCYSTPRTILNWQFHLNYVFLTVCNITGGKDNYVA